jgi:flagellar hook-basal body complex protein FliE
MTHFVPKMTMGIQTPQNTGFVSSFPTEQLDSMGGKEKGSFKNVMSNLTSNLNETVNAPDQLLQDSLTGKADIHDVIIAMNKAELGVNIATQLTTKIVQSYEKIMAIQV